ncbi:hypothetical protein AQS8620_00969 [Aquimixticola soesokkakensis]|uniref:DUF5337 domain-containing protein n=1 Tax=Aquimixticola soesokkakensis TaxID=1519096 RepID=A0A1Y5S1W5_9RHOB|nr:DUF5337 domain-containing protein [Aquimixticola soesokkakensis]SLN30651.1 hypothetical protein AQS8620_00969 [Aquimixticola soesokkakensis]
MAPDEEQKLAKRARATALVIAFTMMFWLGAQWLGGRLGLAPRYVFLFDFAALAAFLWALVNVYQIWRSRQKG